MNKPFAICLIVLGFIVAGGLGIIVDARKAAEKKAQSEKWRATVASGIDAAKLLLEEKHYQATARDYIDLPPSWRQKNWSQGGGSCVYATAISMLRWQGFTKEAEEIRRTCGGGSCAETVSRKMKALGLKVAWSNDADRRLFDFGVASRRGVGVGYHGHCTLVVGHANGEVIILDNNHVDRLTHIPEDRFFRESSGRDEFVVMGTPPPPTPK